MSPSNDKPKIHIYYRNAYGHKIWQDSDLNCAVSTHRVTWPCNCVILQDHVTNQKHISITKMPIVTKFGTIVTNLKGFLSMLLDPLVMWSCKLTQQTKTITSAQPQWLWPPNLAIVWITKRVPHHKVAWPYDQALYLH